MLLLRYVDQLNAFPEFTSHWADCLQTSARLFLFTLTISLLLALCYMLKYPCFYKNKLKKKKGMKRLCQRQGDVKTRSIFEEKRIESSDGPTSCSRTVTPDLETTREFEKHGRRRPHGPRNSLSDYFFRGILKNNGNLTFSHIYPIAQESFFFLVFFVFEGKGVCIYGCLCYFYFFLTTGGEYPKTTKKNSPPSSENSFWSKRGAGGCLGRRTVL